jgi:hypothetical protein
VTALKAVGAILISAAVILGGIAIVRSDEQTVKIQGTMAILVGVLALAGFVRWPPSGITFALSGALMFAAGESLVAPNLHGVWNGALVAANLVIVLLAVIRAWWGARRAELTETALR